VHLLHHRYADTPLDPHSPHLRRPVDLPDPDRQRLVIYLPDDPATSKALDRLPGRAPGALRLVRAG
jgi:hypothetical protein